MKIYRLCDPTLEPSGSNYFRDILVTGTWQKVGKCTIGCRACVIVPPLIVEANSDGILMGDVAWSFDIFIASEKAKNALKSMGDHWDFESVVVSQKSRAYKTLLKQNYIWPIAKKKIEIDPIINNLDWEAACPKCETSRWSYKHIDIIFPNNNIDEVDCFRIDCGLPYRYHSYVTEKYWHEIAKFNLTNIDAMVAGEAIF